MLHHQEDRPVSKAVREMEAEAVAFVVARLFGLDGVESSNYLALHGANSAVVLEHLDRIRITADEIIEEVEQDDQLGGLKEQ